VILERISDGLLGQVTGLLAGPTKSRPEPSGCRPEPSGCLPGTVRTPSGSVIAMRCYVLQFIVV